IGFNTDDSPIAARQLSANVTRRFKIAGRSFGVGAVEFFRFPDDVSGVLVNVTIVQEGASGGYVTVYAGDLTSPPNASTVNRSTPIAHNFWATGIPQRGPYAGTLAVYPTNRLHVIIDVVGYWALSNLVSPGSLRLVAPLRVLDTRAEAGGPIGYGA